MSVTVTGTIVVHLRAFADVITATQAPTPVSSLPRRFVQNAIAGDFNGAAQALGDLVRARVSTLTPVITSPLSASGTATQAFTYNITATNSPTSFNATGLPAGLTVNTSTGVITGAASSPGTTTVGVSAANATGVGTANVSFTFASAYNSLLVGTSAGVYQFSGSGWSRVAAIPATYACVTQDPVTGNIYASTAGLINVSTDSGTTWTPHTLTNRTTAPMQVYARGGTYYAIQKDPAGPLRDNGGAVNFLVSNDLTSWSPAPGSAGLSSYGQTFQHGQYLYMSGYSSYVVWDISSPSNAPVRQAANFTNGFNNNLHGSLVLGATHMYGSDGNSNVAFNRVAVASIPSPETGPSTWTNMPSTGFEAYDCINYCLTFSNPGQGKIFASLTGESQYSGVLGVAPIMKYLASSGGVDGATWNDCSLPSSANALVGTHAGYFPVWDAARSQYVALVTSTNGILKSSDGVAWTDGPSLPAGLTTDMRTGSAVGLISTGPTPALLVATLNGVYYFDGSSWVAHPGLPTGVDYSIMKDPLDQSLWVSGPSGVYSSTDSGVSWVYHNYTASYPGRGQLFRYGGRLFLAHYGSGTLVYSDDYTNWTVLRSGGYFNISYQSGSTARITRGTNNGAYTILDLTTSGLTTTYVNDLTDICSSGMSANHRYVATWGWNSGSHLLYSSSDTGFVLTDPGITASGYHNFNIANPGNGKFYVSLGGYNGGVGTQMAYLPYSGGVDGGTWSTCTLPARAASAMNIAVIPYWDSVRGRYIAVTNSNMIFESVDGVTWVDGVDLPVGATADQYHSAVIGAH